MKNRPLTVDEFCEKFSVCRATAYGLIRSGKLRAVKLGRKTLLPDLEAFVASLPNFQFRAGDRFGHERAAEIFDQTKAKAKGAHEQMEGA
jgi:excisionase family DNA binding protein